MPTLSRLAFRFGPFELRTGPTALYRFGELVGITPKALATLAVLVTQHGKAISKEDLLTAVWSDTAVGEASLSQNVYTLRKLLAPDFPNQNPIENVPRFGYRFSVAVEVSQDQIESSTSALSLSRPEGEKAELLATSQEPLGEACESGDQDQGEPFPGTSTADLNMGDLGRKDVRNASPEAKVGRSSSFVWWIVAGPLLVLLAVFGSAYVRHWGTLHRPKPDFVRFTSNSNENRVSAAAISPDGRSVAYADADGVVIRGEHDIATHRVATPAVQQVERLSWSPDARSILLSGSVATGAQQLWMLSVAGNPPILLRDHARLGTVSPDGSNVAFVTEARSEVWVMGRAGENPRQVFAGTPNDTFPMVLWAADGEKLLLERHASVQSDGHFHASRTEDEIEGFHPAYLAVSIATGRVTAVEDGVRMGNACLLDASRMLFSRFEENEYGDSTSLWKVSLDPRTGAFVSTPERVRHFEGMHLLTLSAAKSGDIAAVLSHGTPGIYVGSLQGENIVLTNVKLLAVGHGGPHGWTADSNAVVFESNNVDLHHYHIYKQELTRHEPESLTGDMGGEFLPRLTPDRRFVLFETKSKDKIMTIWRLALSGGAPTPIHQSGSDEYRCPLSGSACVLATPLDSRRLILSRLDPMNGAVRQAVTVPAGWEAHGDWDVSPDGSEVALVSSESPQPEIRVVQLVTGKTEELLVPVASPLRAINWMPNGKGWIVASSSALGNELLYVDLKGSTRLLREVANYTWGVPSPDGTKLAFADRDVDSNVWLLRDTP